MVDKWYGKWLREQTYESFIDRYGYSSTDFEDVGGWLNPMFHMQIEKVFPSKDYKTTEHSNKVQKNFILYLEMSNNTICVS